MQFATDIAAYTCICCPLGCRIEVALDENGQVSEVSGYTCKRGADYAAQEAVAPERMVTAVLPVSGCLEPVSAKTQRPVPKAAMKDVLAAVAALRLDAPVELAKRYLPLFDLNLGWLLPACIGFVIGMILRASKPAKA